MGTLGTLISTACDGISLKKEIPRKITIWSFSTSSWLPHCVENSVCLSVACPHSLRAPSFTFLVVNAEERKVNQSLPGWGWWGATEETSRVPMVSSGKSGK